MSPNISLHAVFALALFVHTAQGWTVVNEVTGTREAAETPTTQPPRPTYPPIANPVMVVDMWSELTASATLSQSCLSNYAKQFTQTLNNNLVDLKRVILSTPSFCPGATDAFLNNAYSTLTAQGLQVTLAFGVDVESIGTNTFEAVAGCSYQVGNYLESFDNWLQPIIRDVANCPRLTFRSTSFTVDGLEWVCNQ